jgi:hypothetical protein
MTAKRLDEIKWWLRRESTSIDSGWEEELSAFVDELLLVVRAAANSASFGDDFHDRAAAESALYIVEALQEKS